MNAAAESHDQVMQVETEVDLDYMFQMPKGNTTATFKNHVQRYTKPFIPFRLELAHAKQLFGKRNMSASRIDLCEVMCGDQSELTRQTISLGGKAIRFSKESGDLYSCSKS
jgi:hypothetical protein